MLVRVGILAVAIIATLIRTVQKRRGVQPGDYDERQQLQRGAAAQQAIAALAPIDRGEYPVELDDGFRHTHTV